MNLDCILTFHELQHFPETSCYNLNYFSTKQREVNDCCIIEFESNLIILY